MPFVTKLRGATRYYEKTSIAKASIIILEENRLRKSFEFWQVILHLNPPNDVHKSTIMYLWYELQVLVDKKDGCRIHTKTK